jgi:hypothetical protein
MCSLCYLVASLKILNYSNLSLSITMKKGLNVRCLSPKVSNQFIEAK